MPITLGRKQSNFHQVLSSTSSSRKEACSSLQEKMTTPSTVSTTAETNSKRFLTSTPIELFLTVDLGKPYTTPNNTNSQPDASSKLDKFDNLY